MLNCKQTHMGTQWDEHKELLRTLELILTINGIKFSLVENNAMASVRKKQSLILIDLFNWNK